MEQSLDPPMPRESELHHVLERMLFRFETATLIVLLLITLVQPTVGRMGLPTSMLMLLALGYRFLVEVLRTYVLVLHAFAWKYVLDVPVAALIYAAGAEGGGPLFVLFFLAIACATATMTLRGSLIYTAAVVVLVALIDLGFAGWTIAPAVLQDGATRVAILAIFGTGTAILRRRLMLQQAAERAVRDTAAHLAELDRLRADFVATISHDLRTPLTAIRAGLGLLAASAHDRLLGDERHLLANGQRNVERLSRLIDDLLAYNQLEAGTLRLECAAIDLRRVVFDAVAAVLPLVAEKQQQLDVHLAEPLPCVGDARRLEQVLVNLLANAHEHTPAGTHITVRGQRTADGMGVSVADNGPGVPFDAQEMIFERFQRRSSAAGGSGLGLTIVQRIVAMHGGRVWVESMEGQGACFCVVLPCSTNEQGGEM